MADDFNEEVKHSILVVMSRAKTKTNSDPDTLIFTV
jgi:hypothetical protein